MQMCEVARAKLDRRICSIDALLNFWQGQFRTDFEKLARANIAISRERAPNGRPFARWALEQSMKLARAKMKALLVECWMSLHVAPSYSQRGGGPAVSCFAQGERSAWSVAWSNREAGYRDEANTLLMGFQHLPTLLVRPLTWRPQWIHAGRTPKLRRLNAGTNTRKSGSLPHVSDTTRWRAGIRLLQNSWRSTGNA